MNKKREKMLPIPIEDLVNGISCPVDLYVRLGETKYVLVSKKGTVTQKDQLSNYQSKRLDYLWTPFSNYHLLTRQNIAIAGVAVNKANLNDTSKTKFIAAAANTVFEHLNVIGISKETYESVRQVSEATVSLVENHKDLFMMFQTFEKYSNHILKHSLAVSAISTILGSELGWKNKVTLEKLALGGLLHDIGKIALPPEISEKPHALLTYEEVLAYESHAYRGMEMITSLGIVPDDIVSIIYEHHENSIGQGFPRRLRDLKIHPMAKVVSLCDEFVNLTVSSPSHPNPMRPREAIEYIERVMGQPFNKECFRALHRLILKESIKQTA